MYEPAPPPPPPRPQPTRRDPEYLGKGLGLGNPGTPRSQPGPPQFPPPPPPLAPPPGAATQALGELEIQVQQISYTFYSKPLGSKFTILETSAAAYNSKKASLAQECVRRLLNSAEDRPQAELNKTINEFQNKLKASGYSAEQQREIIESGLIGYKRRLAKQGGVKHRNCKETEKERERKKLLGKANWFKKKGSEKEKETQSKKKENMTLRRNKRKRDADEQEGEYEKEIEEERDPITVLFVPRTPGGELANQLKKKEEELGKLTTHRIRIVERNGEKLEHILTKPDPFGQEKCKKETCLLCRTDEKEMGKCKKKNIVYKIECRLCLKQGKTGTYWGETARTAQLRGGEHYKDFETQKESSHMLEHLELEHSGEGKDQPAHEIFKMQIHKRYRSALERQLGEAQNIARAGGAGAKGLLNRKEEYSRCVVPELAVSEGWRGETTQKRVRDQENIAQNPAK